MFLKSSKKDFSFSLLPLHWAALLDILWNIIHLRSIWEYRSVVAIVIIFFCSCVHFSLFRFIYLCIEFYLSLSSFFADVAERKSVSGKSNDISAFVVMIVSILLRVCVALETVSLGKVMQKQCILFKRVWTKKISIKWSICRSRARFLLYLASIFRSSCFKILCKHLFDILLGAVFHLCVLYLFIWTVISLDSCFLLYELVL